MTGSEHYRAAEHLLDVAQVDLARNDAARRHAAACALVHATLALAAAMAAPPLVVGAAKAENGGAR